MANEHGATHDHDHNHDHDAETKRGRSLEAWGRTLIGLGVVLVAVALWLFFRARFIGNGWVTWSPAIALACAAGAVIVALVGIWLRRRGHELAHDTPSDFLPGEQEQRVVEAIQRFERRTSGEIRVHLDYHSTGDPSGHAVAVFERIGMTATAERNAVLFFVAVRDPRFSVVGDEGIDRAVHASFWEEVVQDVEQQFCEGAYTEGLIAGIDRAGEALAEHFPYRDDDLNELPDDISRS